MHETMNPSQKEAICHFRGPCEVIAGPGSGKTFVLVERILHLIGSCSVAPSGILVLTFSRAAAQEMQARYLQKLRELSREGPSVQSPPIPPNASSVTFGTFHSVFLNILQNSSPTHFSILDDSRKRSLLRALFLQHYGRYPKSEELADLSSLISKKKTGESPQDLPFLTVRDSLSTPAAERESLSFSALFADYEAYLQENSLLDFDDMIAKCVQLLQQDAGLRAFWQKRFPFLLVDEFQDINQEQFEGVRILAGEDANLFVVGDDDQSIYAFRGSNPGIMIGFSKAYPGTHSITLSVNYRSLPPIITCGQKVITQNKTRLPKTAVAARQNTDSQHPSMDACMRLLAFHDEKEEQDWILRQLQAAAPEELQASAVILRSNAQLLEWASFFEKSGISCRFFTGINQNAGRSSSNNTPPKGAGTQALLSLSAPQARRLLSKAASSLELASGYYRLSGELAAGSIKRADLFFIMNQPERCLLRRKFQEETYTEASLLAVYPVHSLEHHALQTLCRDLKTLQRLSPLRSLTYLRGILCAEDTDEDLRLLWEALFQHLQEREQALSHCSPSSLCEVLSRITPWDLVSQIDKNAAAKPKKNAPAAASPGGRDGVLLLTMHASKGLEFHTVYLPDLNEGLFPGRRAQSEEAIEEERRLFYVAITRARDRLNLMYLCGTPENPRRPSRFLAPLGVRPWE